MRCFNAIFWMRGQFDFPLLEPTDNRAGNSLNRGHENYLHIPMAKDSSFSFLSAFLPLQVKGLPKKRFGFVCRGDGTSSSLLCFCSLPSATRSLLSNFMAFTAFSWLLKLSLPNWGSSKVARASSLQSSTSPKHCQSPFVMVEQFSTLWSAEFSHNWKSTSSDYLLSQVVNCHSSNLSLARRIAHENNQQILKLEGLGNSKSQDIIQQNYKYFEH